MVEPVKYRYKTILITESRKQHDISEFIEGLGWEELEKELAARISFTAKNDKTAKGRISALTKPNCYIVLLYSYDGGKTTEAVRGKINEWNPSAKFTLETLKVKAYDELHDLEESDDDLYYSSGAGTKSVLTKLFSDWKIPVGRYTGPDVKHGKLKYDKKSLGSIVTEILEEAKKKGGGDTVIRAVKGKVDILSYGSNTKIYHFEETEHLLSLSHKISVTGMVTRVKVVGEENDDGRRPVEATVDGKIKYGIRQKIYTRGSDESLGEAKEAAQGILDEDGEPEEEINIEAPDIPEVRKGDLVHLKTSTVGSGYFYVLEAVHDCDSGEMELKLKRAPKRDGGSSGENQDDSSKDDGNYNVGDIVDFHGGMHYVSSDSSSGYKVSAGKAKITHTSPGNAHPWHLETQDWEQTHVYGWVDEGSFG